MGIKNPKGFEVNRQSFNEFFVAGMTLEEFIKYGKEKYKGDDRPFFGRRNDKEQEQLLSEVWDKATGMVKTAPDAADTTALPPAPVTSATEAKKK